MKILAITVLVLAFANSGGFAANPHPRPKHEAHLLTARVCAQPVSLVGRFRLPRRGQVYVDAWVDGYRLHGYVSEGDTYLFGRSTIVQTPVKNGRRISFRAVRTVPHCAKLRVRVEW